ncbi:hypothetical protein VA7868_03139 [Vibrio aerogenes CECT 7868]|uniref:Uncharacterized protein n=1 Tax=Vibrio aerogenes CECT 7868 TaxID=1216006 RepID=A0A1M5ZSF8_9VIBR|nr:DUF6516 family protein [Vibrio aerogenes]SHI27098.1 hypothetical protein VA7868_03139 [Vibrio aerogenes CECT 7868]
MKGLDVLLSMHGIHVHRDDGYWWKIEVWTVPPTKERPHGIRYNMTLHNQFNKRVFGLDNAHAVKAPKRHQSRGKGYEYDHLHQSAIDQGTRYEFSDCYALLQDFFSGIDATIEAIERK